MSERGIVIGFTGDNDVSIFNSFEFEITPLLGVGASATARLKMISSQSDSPQRKSQFISVPGVSGDIDVLELVAKKTGCIEYERYSQTYSFMLDLGECINVGVGEGRESLYPRMYEMCVKPWLLSTLNGKYCAVLEQSKENDGTVVLPYAKRGYSKCNLDYDKNQLVIVNLVFDFEPFAIMKVNKSTDEADFLGDFTCYFEVNPGNAPSSLRIFTGPCSCTPKFGVATLGQYDSIEYIPMYSVPKYKTAISSNDDVPSDFGYVPDVYLKANQANGIYIDMDGEEVEIYVEYTQSVIN